MSERYVLKASRLHGSSGPVQRRASSARGRTRPRQTRGFVDVYAKPADSVGTLGYTRGMYTGITRGVFPVIAVEVHPGHTHFTVQLNPELTRDIQIGASVAIDGVCCTVVTHADNCLSFDAMQETRALTTLSTLHVDRRVSVERSCRIGDELGGHDVYGHVIGTGTICARHFVGEQLDLTVEVPAAWMRFILHKGFIAVDGSSLTVGHVHPEGRFELHLIPETLRVTNFANKQIGDRVNIELDARTVAIVETVERVLSERAGLDPR